MLFVSPSAVEVERVEKLCELATCPTLMLNPRLEDVAIVGIGYAGRQLRTRFLNNIESCYYLRPIENISVFRSYPGEWQIWREVEEEFQLIAEQPTKPMGDEIDTILYGVQVNRIPLTLLIRLERENQVFSPVCKDFYAL
ncbi:MAG: hypothetical protein N4J56_003550 [Chroococcidiopsis sp. SAG 2025]|nr:DUF1995 family protein [Chroococcidiopsis sp. SAG 2025]MDV2993896.1 hypothetical protein [Chroococcidiopsis sp. SAG 2025]